MSSTKSVEKASDCLVFGGGVPAPKAPVKLNPTKKAPLSAKELLDLGKSYDKAMEKSEKEEVIDLDDTEETTDEEPELTDLQKKLEDNSATFKDIDDAYKHVKIITRPEDVPDCVFNGMKKRKIANNWLDANNIAQALIIQRMIRDADCAAVALQSVRNCMKCLYKFNMDDLNRLMNNGVKYYEDVVGDNVQRMSYMSLMLNQCERVTGDVRNLTSILSDRWDQANSIALGKKDSKYDCE